MNLLVFDLCKKLAFVAFVVFFFQQKLKKVNDFWVSRNKCSVPAKRQSWCQVVDGQQRLVHFKKIIEINIMLIIFLNSLNIGRFVIYSQKHTFFHVFTSSQESSSRKECLMLILILFW